MPIRPTPDWASYIKEVPVDVPGWLSFVVSLFFPLAFVLNIVGEVLRYFI